MAQEQLLERGRNRLSLLRCEGFEESLVDGYQFMKCLPGDLAAVRRETDEHTASIDRVGSAADEPGTFEAVEA